MASNSDSSSSSSDSSSSSAAAEGAVNADLGQDPTPFHMRVDNDARPVDVGAQLNAYMWTLPRAGDAVTS